MPARPEKGPPARGSGLPHRQRPKSRSAGGVRGIQLQIKVADTTVFELGNSWTNPARPASRENNAFAIHARTTSVDFRLGVYPSRGGVLRANPGPSFVRVDGLALESEACVARSRVADCPGRHFASNADFFASANVRLRIST